MASLPYPRCQILYSVNSVGEQRTLSICVNPCHLWEKRYSRRTHGTHGTFWQRRASHRCSQIRRVWHPCHTHAAKFCVFCEFRGRTAHHNHLCPSVPSVGVLSLQEGSVRSVHSVGGVAVVWCSRDCCTLWWCIRALCGRFSQQSASVSSACFVEGQRPSNLL